MRIRTALVCISLGLLSACGPSPAPPAASSSSAAPVVSNDVTELATLDQARTNGTDPFKGLPEAPVVLVCMQDQAECDSNRLQFYHAWVEAWHGGYQGQRNVAYMLSNPLPGVMPDALKGCAWRHVIIDSGHVEIDQTDAANLKNECGKLSASDQAAAVSLAKGLRAQIKP